MFATENDYTEAVRGSQIHTYENEAQKKTTIINLLILTTLIVLGYFGFNYYKKNNVSISNSATIAQKAVLGVSHTASTFSNKVEEDDYLIALENMEVDTLDSNQVASTQATNSSLDISEAMSSIVESSMESHSNYAEDISKEITKDKLTQKRVIVVQKGDTLASLSKKYYGSAMNYKEIVASNSKISRDSGLIYVGQKIVLPY